MRPFFHKVLGTQTDSCTKIANFDFQGPLKAHFGSKIGSNLAPKDHKCTKGTLEPNETIYSHSFRH